MTEEPQQYNQEQLVYVSDLLYKATKGNDKTNEHRNAELVIDGHVCNLRIDDKQLLSLGVQLLPNVVNYLVNVLPTLIYPYVISYLQDLSDDDQPITINDLYDMVESLQSKYD